MAQDPSEDTPKPAAAPPLSVPGELRELEQYEIVEKLGAGGFGLVYKALNKKMGRRPEALKLLNNSVLQNPEARLRFEQEIAVVSILSGHPNIVTAYNVFSLANTLVLAMEYVDGVDLETQVTTKGVLSVHQASRIIRQAADGLQHAFENQILHRDIKPANLMVSKKGRVKILDFGLGKAQLESLNSTTTKSGLGMGTPHYMSPEQLKNASNVDIRSDIYSLGCTLYYLLSGRPPIGGSPLEFYSALAKEQEPPLISKWNKKVPSELVEIIAAMIHPNPDYRPATPSLVSDQMKFVFDLSDTRSGSKATSEEMNAGGSAGSHARVATSLETPNRSTQEFAAESSSRSSSSSPHPTAIEQSPSPSVPLRTEMETPSVTSSNHSTPPNPFMGGAIPPKEVPRNAKSQPVNRANSGEPEVLNGTPLHSKLLNLFQSKISPEKIRKRLHESRVWIYQRIAITILFSVMTLGIFLSLYTPYRPETGTPWLQNLTSYEWTVESNTADGKSYKTSSDEKTFALWSDGTVPSYQYDITSPYDMDRPTHWEKMSDGLVLVNAEKNKRTSFSVLKYNDNEIVLLSLSDNSTHRLKRGPLSYKITNNTKSWVLLVLAWIPLMIPLIWGGAFSLFAWLIANTLLTILLVIVTPSGFTEASEIRTGVIFLHPCIFLVYFPLRTLISRLVHYKKIEGGSFFQKFKNFFYMPQHMVRGGSQRILASHRPRPCQWRIVKVFLRWIDREWKIAWISGAGILALILTWWVSSAILQWLVLPRIPSNTEAKKLLENSWRVDINETGSFLESGWFANSPGGVSKVWTFRRDGTVRMGDVSSSDSRFFSDGLFNSSRECKWSLVNTQLRIEYGEEQQQFNVTTMGEQLKLTRLGETKAIELTQVPRTEKQGETSWLQDVFDSIVLASPLWILGIATLGWLRRCQPMRWHQAYGSVGMIAPILLGAIFGVPVGWILDNREGGGMFNIPILVHMFLAATVYAWIGLLMTSFWCFLGCQWVAHRTMTPPA